MKNTSAIALILTALLFSENAALAGTANSRIFAAVLPMTAVSTNEFVHQLSAAGLTKEWLEAMREYLGTGDEIGNSMPIVMPTHQGGFVCVAAALRYDINKTMGFTPVKDAQTREAVTVFLLAHEVSHCEEALKQLDQNKAWTDEAYTGEELWREESLADQRARVAVHQLGISGWNALQAWETRRFYGFLEGDLEHWSTPLIIALGETTSSDSKAMLWAGSRIGGMETYQRMNFCRGKLANALFAGEDTSAEQSQAWEYALNECPEGLRTGLPSLSELRTQSKALWLEEHDWRLKAVPWHKSIRQLTD